MNVSAMRRVLTTLPESFGLFLYLRREYLERLSRKELLFVDLWRMGVLATSLPKFLASRKLDAVPDGELPPYIADAYKFSAGVTILMMRLAFQEAAPGQRGILPAMTVESLLKKADKMLVSEREVCAAPPTLIAEALSAFVAGKVDLKTVEPPAIALIKDFDAFFAFASVNMDLKLTLWLLATMRECVVKDLLTKVKANEKRGKKGRSVRAPVLKSLTAALTGTHSPWRLDGLADAMRSRILKSGRDKQCSLLNRMAAKLVSQPGEEGAQLLQKLERAAGTVQGGGAVNPIHLAAIRKRWPRVTEAAARRCAAAWGDCQSFETAALETLGALESSLRVSLGHRPIGAPLPAGILTSAIGPSCTEALNSAFALARSN